VMGGDRTVPALAHDPAVEHHHGPDRDFVLRLRLARKLQRPPHEVFVIHQVCLPSSEYEALRSWPSSRTNAGIASRRASSSFQGGLNTNTPLPCSPSPSLDGAMTLRVAWSQLFDARSRNCRGSSFDSGRCTWGYQTA